MFAAKANEKPGNSKYKQPQHKSADDAFGYIIDGIKQDEIQRKHNHCKNAEQLVILHDRVQQMFWVIQSPAYAIEKEIVDERLDIRPETKWGTSW